MLLEESCELLQEHLETNLDIFLDDKDSDMSPFFKFKSKL